MSTDSSVVFVDAVLRKVFLGLSCFDGRPWSVRGTLRVETRRDFSLDSDGGGVVGDPDRDPHHPLTAGFRIRPSPLMTGDGVEVTWGSRRVDRDRCT